MAKKSAGSVSQERIVALGTELATNQAEIKRLEKECDRLKGEIANIAARFTLPVADGQSEYQPLPSGAGSVRITRPRPPVQKVLTDKLLENIRRRPLSPDEANRVFLDVFVLPKYAEVDAEKFRAYIDDETLLASTLRASLEPERPAAKPNVQLTSRSDF